MNLRFNISAEKEGVHLKDRIAAINPDETGINSENMLKNEEKINTEKIEKKENSLENNVNRFSDNDDINRFKPKQ